MSAGEKTPAEIVAHLRHEARFVEVATAMNDEVTVEYANMCIGAADCIEALTAERDALKAENERIRDRDVGLIHELIDALTGLHERDDCNDLERSARINELRRDLDLLK